ncbi:signal peptidase I [Boudabousia liubingyangii]|uniref:Signal peptidase I n=1 Tax=Boudabousia liubingyangii TaxID=1921764 RepID=A0A1Q5PKP7_9ACTO|nr:signal peptidase I [Boudabousia liubingyangii]OKL46477.1 signal peptidase I [Boudabousia liubingyangii]OKL47200.1 signal peptidase I [Boudabousia liubingyangii]
MKKRRLTESGPVAHSALRETPRSLPRQLFEYLFVILIAIGVMTGIRQFVVQRFYIPSGSMETTLMPGDYVLASKLTPAWVPIERGDIVVFADNDDWLGQPPESKLAWWEKPLVWSGVRADLTHQQLIKRVIGLPGDRVECCDQKGRLKINGVPIDEPYVADGQEPSLKDFSVTVPAGRLWVMGDNRSHSADSREHMENQYQGTISIDSVLGKAFVVVWPYNRWAKLAEYRDVYSKVPPASGN